MEFDQHGWDLLKSEAQSCLACKLSETRTQVVFGEGNPQSPLLFVGEGPGEQEDRTGKPFVGPAGQLLDKMLAAVQLDRTKVYIANVIKCRPPGNRDPHSEELEACQPIFESQLARIQPKILITLGNVPTRALLGPDTPGITKIRGVYRDFRPGITLVPWYHPSYLLRNDSRAKGQPKSLAWQDAKELKRRYDLLQTGKPEAMAEALAASLS